MPVPKKRIKTAKPANIKSSERRPIKRQAKFRVRDESVDDAALPDSHVEEEPEPVANLKPITFRVLAHDGGVSIEMTTHTRRHQGTRMVSKKEVEEIIEDANDALKQYQSLT